MIRDRFGGVPKMSIELQCRAAIFDAEADRDFLDDFEQGRGILLSQFKLYYYTF